MHRDEVDVNLIMISNACPMERHSLQRGSREDEIPGNGRSTPSPTCFRFSAKIHSLSYTVKGGGEKNEEENTFIFFYLLINFLHFFQIYGPQLQNKIFLSETIN